jgi:hypothetical protein
MEVVDLAGLESKARDVVVDRLIHIGPKERYWDLDQRCWLATAFAKRGHPPARAALYQAFGKAKESQDLVGAEQIIHVDGADGLIFLAQRITERYLEDDWTHDEPMTWFDELHGKGKAEQILDLAAQNDERIAAYLASVRAFRSDATELFKSPRKPLAEILEQIQVDTNTRFRFLYRRWGKKASEEELAIIFERILCETDEVRLCHLLAIFMHRPMARFDPRLLAFVEHPSEDVQWWAIQALANYSNDEVRSLAIQRARAGRTGMREIELFRLNYLPGDWEAIISPNSELPNDNIDLHAFLQSLFDVLEKRDLLESAHPLMLMYEYSPCSMCRERALEELLRLRAAPDWVLVECRQDCSGDIRKLVEQTGPSLK